MSRFEMDDRLVCIKEYKTFKVGSHYPIKGRGDLGIYHIMKE
mgnify:CR=1 FL=1